MRYFFVSVVAIILTGSVGVADPAKKSVTILKVEFIQKEEKQSPVQYLAEYLPANQTFENYTEMFAVWGQLDKSTSESQVKAKIEFVNSRKSFDPVANFTLFKSDDKSGYGLDFVVSEGAVTEHNVWYYMNVKGGVLAYQYNRRFYKGQKTSSAKEFIAKIPTVRDQILEALKAKNMPVPKGYQK